MDKLALVIAIVVLAGCGAAPPDAPRSAVRHPAPTGWGVPERASVALVRRAVAGEARRTRAALVVCAARSSGYRRCAFRPLARTTAAASAAANTLAMLARNHPPPPRCSALMASLSGLAGALGDTAREMLRNQLGGLDNASARRAGAAVRGLARGVVRLATAPRWARACAPTAERA